MSAIDPREHVALLAEEVARARATDEPAWRAARRKDAASAFSATGFPTTRHEGWRYTNVAPIARTSWQLAPEGTGRLTRQHVERASFPVYACSLFVFVNGRFAPSLSSPAALVSGPQVRSLAAVLREEPALVEPLLGRIAPIEAAPFTALSDALSSDGVVLEIPTGVRVDQPLHIVHLVLPGDREIATFPRALVVARRGSEATVIEDHVSLGAGAYLTCAVSEIVVEQNARLDHVKLERESTSGYHVGTIAARVGRDSRFVSHVLSLGAAIARHELRVTLDGEGASCDLLGLSVASGRQIVDAQTTIEHLRPHGTSRELYKGIFDDRARGVFHGRIVVHEDAQKTDARQTNKTLLLSREAEANSRPQLEISADDVKCSHGATIGQLDDDALFFLRARGIGEVEARRLLLRAFAAEVTSEIRLEPLRGEVEEILLQRLHLGDASETRR